MFRRIKSKVLMVILCTSLGAILLLSLTLWAEKIQTGEPFFLTAPGISLESVRDEAGLLGNTRDILRQIIASVRVGDTGYVFILNGAEQSDDITTFVPIYKKHSGGV